MVAIDDGGNGRHWNTESSLEELAQLALTAGAEVVGRAIQRRRRPSPAHYLGRGKLQELVALRRQVAYNLVLFDDELSPTQQRNLEEALQVKVLDRTALILDIFAQRARTHEGRLQVELAQTEYLLPRLAGQWSHLERLEGRIGTRGPGETQLETDRRLVRRKMGRLRRELEEVRRHRQLYRRHRRRHGVPVISLVGYTNAGKSTLMHALSGADVPRGERLFATLDPLTRRIALPDESTALLTDTVGFIQKLPTQLVASFRATLEEIAEADLVLHVVDITHPDAPEQSETVEETLRGLGVAHKPRITVFNKIDRLAGEGIGPGGSPPEVDAVLAPLNRDGGNTVVVSALCGWGISELRDAIERVLASVLLH